MPVAKLTRKQQKQIQVYVNQAVAALNLTEWDVTVTYELTSTGEDEDKCIYAVVSALEEFRSANISISRKFLDACATTQRGVIIHELMHLLTARVRACGELVEDSMAPKQFELWEDSFHKAEEYAVEMMSRLLVGLLPLPRFG